MITFEIRGVDELKTYLYTIKGRYFMMLEAMIDVAKVVESNTLPLTPYKTGRLGESFRWEVLEYNKDFIEVGVIMDAVDPYDGFHYAEYQHTGINWKTGEPLHHPPPRAGQSWYLKEGINASKSMAYEIIEEDYLSLFSGRY